VLTTIHKSSGFTLIELMITITIFGLALSLGIPSYRTWIQNTQIRNAAESIANGIQLARAEAVKCNASVAFALGAATSWTITHVSNCGTDPKAAAGTTLESRSSGEGSKNATVPPHGAVDKDGNDASTITFSSLGTVIATNADNSTPLAKIDLTSSVSSADLRDLRVAIGLGGNARVCDPQFNSSSTDPRKCY
jgi:type IV fimbrial biogenesis protein FimT